MATNPARLGWSYAEFARLPNDGNRYEIIDGELHVTPAPRPIHQVVAMRLSGRVWAFVDERNLGEVYPAPTDVFLSESHYVQPDLVFVRHERMDIVTERGIEGAPDLIVEVVSPSTALRDRGVKRERYAELGVPLYWVVDADLRQIEVYRFAAAPDGPPEIARDTLVWQPVPGGPELRIDLAAVFRGFD